MRRSALQKDWTKGSVAGNLWSLAWPIIITQSLNMAGPTIDMIWVGRLGAAAIAGVGLSGMVVQMINAIMMGLTTGMRAMIARLVGAGDHEGANHVARQAFTVSGLFAVIVAITGTFFAENILMLFELEADVVVEGVAYMRIMFIGSAAMSFRMMGEGIMQASGDTRTPMRIAIGYRIFHVILAPFLIFGWWIFPSLGVSGAAVTNVISQGLGLAVGMWILFSGRSRLHLSLGNFRFAPDIIWRIVRIGIPAAVTGMQRNLAQLALMWIISPFGTLAVAGHTLTQRIESVMAMPGAALGSASGVLGGQNLGASQPERAARGGWLAVAFAEAIMVTFSIVIAIWAEQIIGIFSPEPEVVAVASQFLRIAAIGYLGFGFVIVLQQCLAGMGDTIPAMTVSLTTQWLLQLPLAYILPKVTGLGVLGVRWPMAGRMLVSGFIYGTYFKLGRWKNKKV
ncbi:MATE family efflux transporter [Chloroflexota bacterium]